MGQGTKECCAMLSCKNKSYILTEIYEASTWRRYWWCKHHWLDSIKGIGDRTMSGKKLRIIEKLVEILTARESVMF